MIDVIKIAQVTIDRRDHQAIYRWARSQGLVAFMNLANVPKGALGLAAQSIFKAEMGVGLDSDGKTMPKLIEQRPMTWYTFTEGATRVGGKRTMAYEFPKGTVVCDQRWSEYDDPAAWALAMVVAFALPNHARD